MMKQAEGADGRHRPPNKEAGFEKKALSNSKICSIAELPAICAEV